MQNIIIKIRAYLAELINDFGPGNLEINSIERYRAALGAFVGILVTGVVSYFFDGWKDSFYLIAPMGASAVLLFALPASPLAQPWSVFVGNTIAALVGVACSLWIANPFVAAAVAVSLAIFFMFMTRSLHPPSGAIALYVVLAGAEIHKLGFYYLLFPVGLNSLILVIVAIIYNHSTRHPYPHRQKKHRNKHHTRDLVPTSRSGFNSLDLDEVLSQYNETLDISREDLEFLIKQTEMQSNRRRFAKITCGDIMSSDLVSVEFGTSLEQAWMTLRTHKIKVLPVVNSAQHLIGVVTLVDFMKHANLDVYAGFEEKLRKLIRLTDGDYSNKPEVVGQIMTTQVLTANVDTHVFDLVPLLSDAGLHHIPILDNQKKVVGMVTQSDLIAALYSVKLAE